MEYRPMSAAVEVDKVTRRYGALCALDEVSLTIEQGELFGLIGHNGAGKTTLFKLMLGLLALDAGAIRIHGQDIAGAAFREVRRGIGYVPESVVFYDHLSGAETLRYFADLKGAPCSEISGALQRVGLSDAGARRVKTYSKGMRQRLGVAQALLGRPRLLFLDEPTSGLDPEGIHSIYRLLHELRGDGVTVVMTSHILSEIQERVDRVAILNRGHIQALGTLQSLREAADLPLWLEAQVVPEALAAVRDALTQLPVIAQRDDGVRRLTVQVRREHKMAVLARLSLFNAQISDLHVREPTLEEMFFEREETGQEGRHGAD
jgi:Cu-processing system ATP-binding protein